MKIKSKTSLRMKRKNKYAANVNKQMKNKNKYATNKNNKKE